MWAFVLIALLAGTGEAPAPNPAASQPAMAQPEPPRQLIQVRRVFVDRFSGGETAAQIRDMIIAALQSTNLLSITENEQKADAILRGSGEDLVFNETHSSSNGLNVHSNLSTSDSVDSSALRGGTRTDDRSGRSFGFGAGESESSHSVERRHEANATVRLVNTDGDVLWSTTQESLGGKFRGASADVADKIARKLQDEFTRGRELKADPPSSAPTPLNK